MGAKSAVYKNRINTSDDEVYDEEDYYQSYSGNKSDYSDKKTLTTVDMEKMSAANLMSAARNGQIKDISLVPKSKLSNDLVNFIIKYDYKAVKYFNDPSTSHCFAAVEYHPEAIQFLPEKKQTAELQNLAVKKNPSVIKFIINPDQKAIALALSLKPNLIKYIKDEEKLKAFASQVALEDSGLYEYVEKYLSKDDKVKLAIKNPHLLKYMTSDIFDIVSETRVNPEILSYLDQQDDDACLSFIKKDPTSIQFVKNQTENLCLSAVKKCGLAIQFIDNPSEQVCLEAVKQNGLSLNFINKQTEEICLAAVSDNWNSIEYVKDKTEKVIMEAFSKNVKSAKLFGNIEESLYIKLFDINPSLLNFLQPPSDASAEHIINKNIRSIKAITNPSDYIAEIVMSRDLSLSKSINTESEFIIKKMIDSGVPANQISKIKKDMVDYAVEKNAFNAVALPAGHLSKEALKKAVSNNGHVLRHLNIGSFYNFKPDSEDLVIDAIKTIGTQAFDIFSRQPPAKFNYNKVAQALLNYNENDRKEPFSINNDVVDDGNQITPIKVFSKKEKQSNNNNTIQNLLKIYKNPEKTKAAILLKVLATVSIEDAVKIADKHEYDGIWKNPLIEPAITKMKMEVFSKPYIQEASLTPKPKKII